LGAALHTAPPLKMSSFAHGDTIGFSRALFKRVLSVMLGLGLGLGLEALALTAS